MGVVGGHRVVSICDVKNGIFKEQRDAARLNMYHMEKFRSTPIAILPVVLVSVFNFLSHFANGPSPLQIGFPSKAFPSSTEPSLTKSNSTLTPNAWSSYCPYHSSST